MEGEPGMGLRPGQRQQAGREVTPLGDPGGGDGEEPSKAWKPEGVGGSPRARAKCKLCWWLWCWYWSCC